MTTVRKAHPTVESLKNFIFEGIDGEECEDLIHAVRLQALEVDKLRDHDYMARWASTRMVGNALRWHVTLPEDIKYNWEKLERALLVEYPINDEVRSRSPRPRAVKARGGRIMVICSDSNRNGYISNGPAREKATVPTSSLSEALLVEWNPPPDGGISCLRLLNQSAIGGIVYDLLGASFNTADPLGQGTAAWGVLTSAVEDGNGAITFAQEFTGPRRVDLWRVAPDNSISMHWDQFSQSQDLLVAVSSNRVMAVTSPSNVKAFGGYMAVRLVLEPIL